jgi:hypothetical protein
MGKGKKNAAHPRYIPRAPQTSLAFIENGDRKFEDLCRDLMAEEPGIADAHLYGRPRQEQFGIDVYAERADESGIEVASCKCYQQVRNGQIATWSTDFLKHWDKHWQQKCVRRFVLCVACDLNSHERREEIEREKASFKRYGVKYEVWTQAKLTRMLRTHPEIRNVYFRIQFDSSAGTSALGPVNTSGPQTSAFLTAAMVSQLSEMQKLLSQAISARLDDLRAALQTGRLQGMETALAAIVADEKAWVSLDTGVQARVLRMQAMLYIQFDKMAAALPLIERAEQLAPEEERRTRAVWTTLTDAADAGLSVLGVPKTQDGALLRVGLFLEMNRLAEAREALTSDPLIVMRDAEWHRLSGCATLYSGDRIEALRHCEAAEALSPDNAAVLETGALVRYGLALSPAANFRFSDGPDSSQVDFGLIDDASQGHLSKALEFLDRLAQRAVTSLQKRRLAMWRLACLALMPDRSKDTKRECLNLIFGQEPSGAAIAWALARGIDFDKDVAEQRLRAQLRGNSPSLEALQGLILMVLIGGDKKQAVRLLNQFRPRFTDPFAQSQIERFARRLTPRHTRSKARAEAGPYDELLSLVKKKWTSQQARLINEYLTDHAPPAKVVMVGSLILASHNEWKSIFPHTKRLLTEVGNAEAIRLSVYARYNTGDYPGALCALEHVANKFPSGKLPPDLLRIQALSAGHEGKFAQALPLAHELAGVTGQPSDKLLYSELAVRSGNIERAVPFVRQLHESGGVPERRLLALLPSISTADPALARRLLSRLTASDLPIEVGGQLLDWHYRLGMEQEGHALFKRLLAVQSKGKKRPLRSVPLSQFAQYVRQRQQQRAELDARLRQDGAPIHVVAGALDANLAEMWDQAFRDRDTVLLIRSANRRSVSHFENLPKRLTLDITAVLSIEHLELLDTLLGSQLELELPASLMEVLSSLEQGIPHRQPARLVTLQKITDFVDSGSVKVFSEGNVLPEKTVKVIFEQAPTANDKGKRAHRKGKGVGSSSEQRRSAVQHDAPSHPPPAVSLGSVGQELVRSGRLSSEDFARIRAEQGVWGSASAGGQDNEINISDALLFQGNTIDSLFAAHLEEHASQRWQLWIEGDHLQRIHAELKASREAQAAAERMGSLREGLAKAVVDDRVKVLAASQVEPGKLPEIPHPILRPLLELLALPTAADRWIWIDDRYCTAYGGVNQTPIATTFEVLRLLQQFGIIDAPRRYELLLKLRRANALYLPIESEELMHWLTRATEREGKLIETDELGVLRRSFNTFAAFMKDLRTQTGPYDQGRDLELPGIGEALVLLRDGLRAVWNIEDTPTEIRVARSQWLWNALRLEVPLNATAAQCEQSLAAWRRLASELVLLGATMSWQEKEGRAADAYFGWLTARLLGINDGSDPALLNQIVSDIGRVIRYDLVEGAQKLADDGVEPSGVRGLLGRAVQSLPSGVQNALYADVEAMTLLGARVRTVVTIGGLEVEPVAFFAALESVAQGTAATVTLAGGEQYTVEMALPRVTLHGSSTVVIAPPEFELLSPDISRRLAFLRSPAGRLDWHQPQDTTQIEELASLPTGWERIYKWAARRDATQVERLKRVEEMIRGGQRVAVGDLIPTSPERYQTYLALVMTNSVIDWDASARTALQRFGFVEALTRWAGLPIRLPEAFAHAYAALESDSRRALHARALAAHATVPFSMRILELSLRIEVSEVPTRSDVFAHILARWTDMADALISMLEWASRTFKRDPVWRNAPAGLRLAATWSHAERTLGTLLESGIARTTIAEFDSLTQDDIAEAVLFEAHLEEDVSSPARLSPRLLLAYMFSATVGGVKGDPLSAYRDDILARLMIERPQGKLPATELFQDRSQGRDALGGGYLGGELDDGLATGLMVGDLHLGTSAARDEIREQSLRLFEQYPRDILSWAQLYSIGQEWSPDAARRRIEAVLLGLEASNKDLAGARVVLIAGSKLCPFLSEDTRRRFAASAVTWVAAFAGEHGSLAITEDESTDIHRDATAVTEFVFGLARRSKRLDSYGVLSEWIAAYSAVWPALGAFWRPLLRQLIEQSTTEESQALWAAHVAVQRSP